MNLRDRHNELTAYVRDGKFAEGIEEFYAADVVARENGNEPRNGRDALAAAEREYLAGVTAYHGLTVHETVVNDQGDGSGTVFYEAEMRWDHKEEGAVHVRQCVIERWVKGEVADIRFYGTFVP